MHKAGVWAVAAVLASGMACAQADVRVQSGATKMRAGMDEQQDKYIWLEDVSSDRAMAWVHAENDRTKAVLEKDARYQTNFDEALKIAEDPTRLPGPMLKGDEIYNQWRDAKNPRGLLRKTTLADYLTAQPKWTPVIDYDALGKAENVGWVPRGMNCKFPGDGLCMVQLSAGGEDATTAREFDLRTDAFVKDGFTLPHSKQGVSWVDENTLLVERDWGKDSLTASGYPYIVKEWKRGTPLESAVEVYRGKPTDVRAGAFVMEDAQGDKVQVFERATDFFHSETSIRTPRGIERLTVPGKSRLAGVLAGRMLVELNEDWTPVAGGKTFPQGSLVELAIADVMKDPAKLKPAVVFAPTAEEFLEGTATTKNHLLLTTLKQVQGRAYVLTPGKDGWTREALPLPENVSVGVATTNDTDDRFFLGVNGFLRPNSVWLGDAAKKEVKEAKSEPAKFDASGLAVEQSFATSKDGTKVPYFVVHPKGIKLDGANPTLLTAYGGFQASMTPYYSATLGKLWLGKGGVFVLANIRGGGEFGPAWHEAGLKTKRQVIYDDFAAVGEDLVKRKITSPAHLGIEGGSNGGLLMGVEMEQHPTLWNAVVIQVPLLDMIRFEKIAAGASWVGEYGSVSVPEERAFLEKISPYANLKPDVKYPEPLIFTTTKDDRVGPQHARKFAARMAEYKLPYYYQEITEGGHGSGADLKQQAGTNAITFTYLERKLMTAAGSVAGTE